MTTEEDYEQQNIGASIAAQKLAEIASTGEHHGVFGGKDMEDAAQAILALHRRIKELT